MEIIPRLELISSAEVVTAGGSVELVCEASLGNREGESCVTYNVTWSGGLLGDEAQDPLSTDNTAALDMNGHVLRIGRVSNTSRYCCQVNTDDTILVECTTIHVREPQGEC